MNKGWLARARTRSGRLWSRLLAHAGLLHWVPLTLIAAGIAASVILSVLPYPSALFSLDGQATAVEFTLASRGQVDSFRIRNITILRAGEVLCDGAVQELPAGQRPDFGNATIGLTALALPSEAAFRAELADGVVRLSLRSTTTNPGGRVSMFVEGPIKGLSCPEDPFGEGHEVEIAPASDGTLIIGFTPPTDRTDLLALASVSRLALVTQLEMPDGHFEMTGTMTDGTLWIENSGFREPPVSSLDGLSFDGIRNGAVRNLYLADGEFHFTASGQAAKIANYRAGHASDIRPSVFDVISQMLLLRVLVGAITLLGGLQFSNFLRQRTGETNEG